ncbi:complement component receptor 1-like protein isoform 6-T6 [Anomaloglossus baeobatrachus]|uniref:complement component receptor 1-like protein isoform X7 n=1 Tax=Anomaloglossus baeobatrachus TaxID=238106 RepID=UPI003F4FB267
MGYYYWTFLLLPAFFGRSFGDCGVPPRLDYGVLDAAYLDQDNFAVGASVNYTCRPGFISVPGKSKVITCLSDSSWSAPEVFCTRRSCGLPGDVENGQTSFNDTLFGSRVIYTCDDGYVMITKRNYRDCLADGTWSNEVAVCQVVTCPPPNAITDGSYNPDKEEYNYQDSVSYTCRNTTFSLIGDRSISCTQYGNWSANPPKCIVVECSSPDVANAQKLSGFVGPYTLNYAVRFQCLSGYTMTGESSVKCNASSQWDPPLPTCSSGNNSGAIVGGVIAGIIGILIAASIMYACWFRRKKGEYIAPAGKKADSDASSSQQPPIAQYDMKQLEAQETH